LGDGGVIVIAQNIREPAERLRRGERPDRAVPLAMTVTVRAELRVAALGGGDAVGCAEAFWIGELSPCGVVFFIGRRQFEIPRDETNFFARIDEGAVFMNRFEESGVGL